MLAKLVDRLIVKGPIFTLIPPLRRFRESSRVDSCEIFNDWPVLLTAVLLREVGKLHVSITFFAQPIPIDTGNLNILF